jgi:Bacterial regulatory helix-turn-helix protein, lysR family
MRFTLAQLKAFYWIAKLGTVRDAARHLNLAQPTVSLRIRDLETALGTMLFERLGRALRSPTRDWSCSRTRRPCSQPPVRFRSGPERMMRCGERSGWACRKPSRWSACRN